jgi:hypothetical protein
VFAQQEGPKRGATKLLLMSQGLFVPAPPGVPVEVHATKQDLDPGDLADSRRNGAKVVQYEGAGHIFADADLPDHNERPAWNENVLRFLGPPRTPRRAGMCSGVSIRIMVKLVKRGIATVHVDRIARPSMVVARLTITDAGHEALAARAAS